MLLLQVHPDQVEDGIRAGEHVVVPNAKHAKSLRRKPVVPRLVVGAVRMLAAVGLDDQLVVRTQYVDDVVADGNLAAKLVSGEAPVSDQKPKLALSFGRKRSHLPRIAAQAFSGWCSPVRSRGFAAGLIPFSDCRQEPLIRPSGTFPLKGGREAGGLGWRRVPFSP